MEQRMRQKGQEFDADRWVDALAGFLRSQADPREMARWVVDVLVGEFDLPLILGHRDSLRHVEEMGAQYQWAVYQGGQELGTRRAITRQVRGHVEGLRDQLLVWTQDEDPDYLPPSQRTSADVEDQRSW